MTAPRATYRLSYGVWLLVPVVIIATAVALLYARAWWLSLDRFVFPILFAATVLIGWYWARGLIRSFHRLELHAEPSPSLSAFGLFGRRLDLPLEGVERVDILQRKALGRTVVEGVRIRTESMRHEMVVTGAGVPIVVSAHTKKQQRQLASVSREIAALTTGSAPTISTRTIRAARPQRGLPTDALWLNRDAGTTGRKSAVLAYVTGVLAPFLVLFAPFTISWPRYDSRVVDAAEVSSELRAGRSEIGAASTAPRQIVDRIEIGDRDCDRTESWLWGDIGGVGRLVATVVVPADAEAIEHLLDRLRLDGWEGYAGKTGGFPMGGGGRVEVDLVGPDAEFVLTTHCMRSDDRSELEDLARNTLAAVVVWALD